MYIPERTEYGSFDLSSWTPRCLSVPLPEALPQGRATNLPGHTSHRCVCSYPPSQKYLAHMEPENWVATWSAQSSVQVAALVLKGAEGSGAEGTASWWVITMSMPTCCHIAK